VNKTSRTIARIAAVAAAAVVFGTSLPANASTTYAPTTDGGAAVGVLVHFKPGFNANGFLGTLAGQDAVAATGVALGSQRALGMGWHVLNFQSAVSEAAASRAVAAMGKQPGVIAVGVNRFIKAAGMRQKLAAQPSVAKALSIGSLRFAAIKAASAPQKVALKDAFSAKKPTLAQLSVSWTKPKSLYGATLVGYRVQFSLDGGKTISQVGGTFGPKIASVLMNAGIESGYPSQARVAAVTKVGKTQKVGTFSAWAKATPTTVPSAPVFVSLGVTSDKPTITWEALSLHDAGGLAVTYQAVASAAGQADAQCVSTSTSCSFVGLAAGVTYSVKIRATNKRGSSSYILAAPVADPDLQFQWYLTAKYGINVVPAWAKTMGSSDVTVAVIDSGVTDHPDLNGQEWRNEDGSLYGYDFVSDLANANDGDGWDANPSDPTADESWHGTHVSGIVGAATNDIGVVGVAPGAKLLEVRALGLNGGTSADLISALLWAAGKDVPNTPTNLHPAKVVNLSLGDPTDLGCDMGTAGTMQTLHDMGVSVITAAGNNDIPALFSYPGDCFPTINVGATGFNGDRAYYSNYGMGVDISAPGGDDKVPGAAPSETFGMIYSTYNDGTSTPGNPTYDNLEGTSMATPMVSGVAALLYSAMPNLTPDQVWASIKASATAWPATSKCAAAAKASDQSTAETCGAGIVNAGGALAYALANF